MISLDVYLRIKQDPVEASILRLGFASGKQRASHCMGVFQNDLKSVRRESAWEFERSYMHLK